MGGAAIGVPAVLNALVSRRARRLPAVTWGSGDRYAWKSGDVVFQHLGDGSPVVLIHSFGPGHGAAEWRRAAEILAQSYEVFAPDLLGWGYSQVSGLTCDSELYIRLIRDFLEDVVGRRAVIVAAGLSAAYAVQIAVDQQELVSGLALVSPLGIDLHGDEPDLKDAVVYRLLRLPILGTSALNLYTSRSAMASYLRREVYASSAAVDDELVDEHYRSSHQPGSQAALAAYLAGYLNHGVREALGRLGRPLWLAWGRHAASPPVETADLWLRQCPDAGLEVFEHAGVLPHAESPKEFCGKLERFLANLGE